MPSVGMRRTTSVFGVVKGIDGGARVLRSGRRLWPESGASKLRRGSDSDEWLRPVDKKGSGRVVHGQKHTNAKNGSRLMDFEVCGTRTSKTTHMENLNLGSGKNTDTVFGLVYSRKRKRNGKAKACNLESKRTVLKEKRFGICFSRRQWNKKLKRNDSRSMVVVDRFDGLVVASVECSSGSSVLSRSIYFENLMCLILRYLRRTSLSMCQIFKFLISSPLGDVYSQRGILFFQVCHWLNFEDENSFHDKFLAFILVDLI